MGKVWIVASGKGGVGKSSLSAGMAVRLASRSVRTLIVDGDIGLRSLDLMMGMQDKVLYDMADCAQRRCALDDATVKHPVCPHLHLMVGGQDARPSDFYKTDLRRMFKTLRKHYDVIIVDCPAGLGRGLKNAAAVADKVILVATPDDVCLRDAEKTAALLYEKTGCRAELAINRYSEKYMRKQSRPLPGALAEELDLAYLGCIPESGRVYQAMLQGKTMAECGDKKVLKALDEVLLRLEGVQISYETARPAGLGKIFRVFNGRR